MPKSKLKKYPIKYVSVGLIGLFVIIVLLYPTGVTQIDFTFDATALSLSPINQGRGDGLASSVTCTVRESLFTIDQNGDEITNLATVSGGLIQNSFIDDATLDDIRSWRFFIQASCSQPLTVEDFTLGITVFAGQNSVGLSNKQVLHVEFQEDLSKQKFPLLPNRFVTIAIFTLDANDIEKVIQNDVNLKDKKFRLELVFQPSGFLKFVGTGQLGNDLGTYFVIPSQDSALTSNMPIRLN